MVFTYKRLSDYVERFALYDDIIDKIESIPNPSSELSEAIVELKAMRAGVRDEAVNYLEAPYRPPPVEDDP